MGLYLFSGRSVWALLVDIQRWIYRAIGWLSAPPTSAKLQHLGQPFLNGARRWHYALGEADTPPEHVISVCVISYLTFVRERGPAAGVPGRVRVSIPVQHMSV